MLFFLSGHHARRYFYSWEGTFPKQEIFRLSRERRAGVEQPLSGTSRASLCLGGSVAHHHADPAQRRSRWLCHGRCGRSEHGNGNARRRCDLAFSADARHGVRILFGRLCACCCTKSGDDVEAASGEENAIPKATWHSSAFLLFFATGHCALYIFIS